MIALAVALIGAGVLGGAALFRHVNHQYPVLVVTAAVPAGAVLTAADIGTTTVAAGPGLQVIPARQERQVVGLVAATSLRPGTLLASSDLTTSLPPRAGQVLVPLPLKPSELPASGLAAGRPPDRGPGTGRAGLVRRAGADRAVDRRHRRGGQPRAGPGRPAGRGPARPGGQRPGPGPGGGGRRHRPGRHQPGAVMTMFALVSPGGSPGVTTAALALTLSWPSRVILAECDPSGGDVLAGLLGGHLPASTGLLPLALEAGAGTEVPADTLWRQLIELDDEHSRLLLAGISDPRQSAALQSSLPWIAEALQGAAADVLADCGRLDSVAAVRPVLSAASLAVLVLRPTLRQLSRAVPRAEMLTSLVGRERVVALLAGEPAAPRTARRPRPLGVPVAGHLADDAEDGGRAVRRRWAAAAACRPRPLLRSAAAAGRALRDSAAAAGPLPGADPVFSPYDDDLAVRGRCRASRPAVGRPGHPVPGPAAAGPPALRPAAFGHPAAGSPVLPGQLESGPPLLGQAGSGRPGKSPPGPPGSGQPSPDWPGLAGAGVSGAGPPPGRTPARPGLPGRPLRTPDQPGTPDLAAEWRGRGSRTRRTDRRLAEAGQPDEPDEAADWRSTGQPDAPGVAPDWRRPGQPDEPDQAPGWPAPGWPEDAWPDARSSGSGWFGSGGRHAARRADDTDPGRGPAGTPPGRAAGARYLSPYPGPAATPNGGSANGTSANGSSANGHSPGGSPNGRSPHDGPAGDSGGTGGGR